MHEATITAVGTKHGRLTVIQELDQYETESGRGRGLVLCRCDCGKMLTIRRNKISKADNAGKIISCGCRLAEYKAELNARKVEREKVKTAERLKREAKREELKPIMEAKRILRSRLNGMIRRCADLNNSRYGGKGITVCDEWKKRREAFIDWAIAHGFRKDLEIDRIDSNKGYCPENCQWIPRKENIARINRNSAKNARVLTFNGETHTMRDWERKLGLKRSTIGWRVRRGWSVEEALYGRKL